jgi:hypothetical protein
MLERCEVIELWGEQQYQCANEACVHCYDCSDAVCGTHCRVCEVCHTVFCSGCLEFHSHPQKVVSVESKRDRRKIA